MAFDWDAMDTWMEEDDVVRVHPRDPYTRIDTLPGSRRVLVEIAGEIIAWTRCPVILFETGLTARYYFKRSEVRMDLLESTGHRTQCPYKGLTSCFSVHASDETLENMAWRYPFPNLEVSPIKDLVAFHDERLDGFSVDGRAPSTLPC